MTIPGYYDLAAARAWHLLLAWPFAFGLAAFLLAGLMNGHFRRDLVTRLGEWRWSAIREDIFRHLRLDFDHDEGKFNFLQKLAYGAIIFIALPAMVLSGLAMSPAMNANWPWLIDLFGGRQSARSIHFVIAWGLCGFLLLHVALVALSGPTTQLRAMITGGRT